MALLNEKNGLGIEAEEVLQTTEQFYLESLANAKAVPEVREHIERSHGRVPFAVVSGGTRSTVEASLAALGLLEKFRVFVCAGDYRKPKPDPEPFLVAAARLGVQPGAVWYSKTLSFGLRRREPQGWPRSRCPNRGNVIWEPSGLSASVTGE